MKLNADLGEGMAFDAELMPLIDMANVACGGHAGDEDSMYVTLRLAKAHNVMVGAHPAYPDLENFGRQSLSMSRAKLIASIALQIENLMRIASDVGVEVSYIKPHGALYNDMMQDENLLADLIAFTSARFPGVSFMLLATPKWHQHQSLAEKNGVRVLFETFADRAYQDNGRLVPRSQANACLSYQAALQQVDQLIDGTLLSHTGKTLQIPSDSVCVHGDNPAAMSLVNAIRQKVSG